EEARAMARVNHDNVVTIYEVGQFNETPFMAMELLHGQSVEHLNECVQEESQRPLSPEQIVQLAIDVSRGLSACHARGVVHRDVKPGNVWIEAPSGRVQLLDFGLAMRNTPTGQLAGIGTVLGTPGYLSPEQAAGEPLDDRTDIYSLGVVLYELCCGELPMLAKTVNAQLISIIAHEPPPLRERNPAVPVPLADLIHQMLQKRPQDRPRGSIALESMFHDVATEMSAPAPLPSVSVPENFHETTSIVATRDTVSDRSDAVRVETTTVELATSGSRGPAASPSVRSRQPRMGLRRGAGTSSLLRNKNVVIGASVLTMVATIVALAYLANYMGSSPVEDTEINRVSNQQNNSTVALRPNINDTPTTDQRSKPNPNSDANQSTPTDNTGDGNPIPPPSLAGD
ncbi:MAG: serine/threonine-protein kinase, partial [Planctomycetota bacterium]